MPYPVSFWQTCQIIEAGSGSEKHQMAEKEQLEVNV